MRTAGSRSWSRRADRNTSATDIGMGGATGPLFRAHSIAPPGSLYHHLCMRNFTFGEIITIVVVILIVFGPNRLPEIARKAGELAAKARVAIRSMREEFGEEYRDVIEPVIEARDQIRATGRELTEELTTLRDEAQAEFDETRLEAERVMKGDDEGSGDVETAGDGDIARDPEATEEDLQGPEGTDVTRLGVPEEESPGGPEVDPAAEDTA